MAINIPWSAFGFESEEDKTNRLRYEQMETVGGLLGESITSEMSGASSEFNMLGQPINIRQQQPTIYDRQGTGYLGSDRGIGAQMALGAGLQTIGGLDASQAQQVMSPQTGLNTAQYSAISELNKGLAKSSEDQLTAVNKLRSPYVKAMTAPRKAMNNYNDAVDLVKDAEFAKNDMLTGAESVALTKKYLKQVLPDESVMGDDIATLLSSQGIPEYMKSFLQSIVGSGTMSKTGASELMKAMATMAKSASGQRDLLREQYSLEAEQYGLPTTFMGERVELQADPMSFEAWKKSEGY